MIITASAMAALRVAWQMKFTKGFEGAKSYYKDVAMLTTSNHRTSVYGWLGQMPFVREWVGDRRIQGLETFAMAIENRDFEMLISVARNDIQDDNLGIFAPLMQEMGAAAAQHPDELIFSLLANGFTGACYDKQNFFDTDHPVRDAHGAEATASNMQAGGETPWFLLDTTRAVRPLIYQQRMPYTFTARDQLTDDNVFMEKTFLYGCDGRSNAGYGLWQMAFGSKDVLNVANYRSAKTSMANLRGDSGKLLGVRPNILVVPPSLEYAGKELLKANLAGGESNIHENELTLIVADWLAQ